MSAAPLPATAPVAGSEAVRYALFAARCAGAAALSQMLAQALGLSFPVWAALSALVVSQERLAETRSSLAGRMLGTACGMAIAVAVHLVALRAGADEQLQVCTAVALGALLARRYPRARTCMWTVAIVLIAPAEGEGLPIPLVALLRGAEVTLGGLVGTAAHFVAEKLFALWLHLRRRSAGAA